MPAEIKIMLLCISLMGITPAVSQRFFKTTTAEVGFFSSAPVEDIRATSGEGIAVLKPETGELSFMVHIRSLKFPKALMQEHFNEDFMESERYPTATFNGKIIKPKKLPARGEIQVLLSGILEIRGIEQKREIPAMLDLSNDQITLKSSFDVACEDHKIKIPRFLWRNIAEVVRVDVNANLKP